MTTNYQVMEELKKIKADIQKSKDRCVQNWLISSGVGLSVLVLFGSFFAIKKRSEPNLHEIQYAIKRNKEEIEWHHRRISTANRNIDSILRNVQGILGHLKRSQ